MDINEEGTLVVRLQLSTVEPRFAILRLAALFADSFMYVRSDGCHMEVYLLPDVPDMVSQMKENGLLKRNDIFTSTMSKELVVCGEYEGKYITAHKSIDNSKKFERLYKYVNNCKHRYVSYMELEELHETKYKESPVISVKTKVLVIQNVEVYPLDSSRYAFNTNGNINQETLNAQKAAIVPSFSSSLNRTDTTMQLCPSPGTFSNSGACSRVPSDNHIASLQSAQICSNESVPSVQSLHTSSLPWERKKARYPKYSTEQSRFQTYTRWPHTDPSAEECVFAGFFYTGDMDLIRCFQCGIGLKDFSPMDNPLDEHVKHTVTCSYLEDILGVDGLKLQRAEKNGMDPENVRRRQYEELLRNRDGNQLIKSPQFSTHESRMITFANENFCCIKTPEQLAEAGLYSTGVGDEVRCFSCNGGLRNWEENDDPWTEHCKWFPSCGFARKIKGKAFIERIQRNMNSTSEMRDAAINAQGSLHRDLQQLDFNLDTLRTTCLEDMGFGIEAFDNALYRLRLKGNPFPNIEDIVNEIDKTEKERPEAASMESFEVNMRLKTMLICQKCKVNNSNALFLPCAHHLMCMECAHNVRKCPLCNRGVNDIVRTYMG